MTRDRVIAYTRELAYMLKNAREAEGALASMNSEIEIAKTLNEPKRAEEVITHRTKVRTQFEKISELAMKKANRKDLDGVERLVQQIQTRLEQLSEYEHDVYVREAQFEMAVASGEFENNAELRKEAEAVLEKTKQRVEQQLKLASDLVPDKPVLIAI